VKVDKHGVRVSDAVELLSKKKQEEGKVTFKCRISRYNDRYTLLAKVLKNDSAMLVVKPGVQFALSNGDTVVLKAERPSSCCSSWADGRWNNVSFKLDSTDVRRLTGAGILSVTIPFLGGECSRKTAPSKERAVAELLRSVGED